MKVLSITLFFVFAIFLWSCGSPFIELTDNYGYSDEQINKGDTDFSKAYIAMKSVLISEFGENFVKENKYPGREHRKFVIYSRQNLVGAGKTRMKVVGFVGRDEYGQVTPVYYCTIQVEKYLYENYATPDPSAKLLGCDISVRRFMDATRSEKLEMKLYNLTMAKLNLGKNKFSGLNNSLPSALLAWNEKKSVTTNQTKETND